MSSPPCCGICQTDRLYPPGLPIQPFVVFFGCQNNPYTSCADSGSVYAAIFETAGHDKPQSRHLVLQMPLHPLVHRKILVAFSMPQTGLWQIMRIHKSQSSKASNPGSSPRSSGKAPSERQQLGLNRASAKKSIGRSGSLSPRFSSINFQPLCRTAPPFHSHRAPKSQIPDVFRWHAPLLPDGRK